MTDRVTYRHEDGVAYITMDDGKVNAMSTASCMTLAQRWTARNQTRQLSF